MDTTISHASLATVNTGRLNTALDLLLDYLLQQPCAATPETGTNTTVPSADKSACDSDEGLDDTASSSPACEAVSRDAVSPINDLPTDHPDGSVCSSGDGSSNKLSRSARRKRLPRPPLSS